jgi:hypothetical protein
MVQCGAPFPMKTDLVGYTARRYSPPNTFAEIRPTMIEFTRKFPIRIAAGVALICSLLFPVSATAGLGESIDSLKSSSFFKFFNLGVTDTRAKKTEKGEAYSVYVVAPKGGDFKSLVQMLVTERKGKITRMHLQLGHSFVRDRVRGVFARDFGKSLLLEALSGDLRAKDLAAAQSLVNEIWKRGARPKKASASYLVWLGKSERHVQTFGASTLTLTNHNSKRAALTLDISFDEP